MADEPKWEMPNTPEERRQMLDSLSTRHENLDKPMLKNFDKLAVQVAKDEEAEAEDFKESQGERD